jgi:hypothetical protein
MDNDGEEKAVLNMTGLIQVSDVSRVMNPTRVGSSAGMVKEYLSQLSCSNIAVLYQRYWPDFMLFQYTLADVGLENISCLDHP